MRNIKTLVVAAGAAVVLGGIGVGVAQAASPGTAPAADQLHQLHPAEPRVRGPRPGRRGRDARPPHRQRRRDRLRPAWPRARRTPAHTGNDDATGSGRLAEGETHAQHTGNDG